MCEKVVGWAKSVVCVAYSELDTRYWNLEKTNDNPPGGKGKMSFSALELLSFAFVVFSSF